MTAVEWADNVRLVEQWGLFALLAVFFLLILFRAWNGLDPSDEADHLAYVTGPGRDVLHFPGATSPVLALQSVGFNQGAIVAVRPGESVLVGRHGDICAITSHPDLLSVSRTQAMVSARQDGSIWIAHEGSNPTLVNGEEVGAGSRQLHEGDRVEAGEGDDRLRLIFEVVKS